MDRRIRKAAMIVSIGLFVALVSLLIQHPLAFMGFLVFGALVIVIGVLYYLISIARGAPAPPAGTVAGTE